MRLSEEQYAAWQQRQTKPQVASRERDFQAEVLKVAQMAGWQSYHTHDSRRSAPGFPDLVLAKPGRLIFAELKTNTGKLTPEQATWLNVLAHTVTGVEVYQWTPRDWDTILWTLTGRRSHAV